VKPCGTPGNTANGEENFPDKWTTADLDDKTTETSPFLLPVLEPLVFVRNYIRYKSSLYTCPDHGTTSSSSYHDIPVPEFRTARSLYLRYHYWEPLGRAKAQAVSRRLPTTAARVPAQVTSCGICGGQSGTGVGFSEYFGFPCQFA
jgi:hypothetical protein